MNTGDSWDTRDKDLSIAKAVLNSKRSPNYIFTDLNNFDNVECLSISNYASNSGSILYGNNFR